MIPIIGEYNKENNKLIIILLSKKNYSNTKIYINEQQSNTTNIKKYKVNKIVLDLKLFNTQKIAIKFKHDNTTLSQTNNINFDNILENVEIVNCDSTLGLEKNLWEKIDDINSHCLIHAGDQIYNDNIFKKYYRYIELTKKNLNKLEKEIYNNYYHQFSRYKNILQNNSNYMIPDDHECVDDAYENKHCSDEKFQIIKKIFEKYSKKIQLELKHNNDEIYYLSDQKNKSIFVLNYNESINSKILDKYNFDKKIDFYTNIILISRKSLLSSKTHPLNQLIFSSSSFNKVDIDFLLKKMIKNPDKKMYIFCGDDHSYKNSHILYKNKKICDITTCGSINTVPEIFKDSIILNTKLPEMSISNKSYELANNFIKINYIKNKIKIEKNIEKKSKLFNLLDNIINIYHLF